MKILVPIGGRDHQQRLTATHEAGHAAVAAQFPVLSCSHVQIGEDPLTQFDIRKPGREGLVAAMICKMTGPIAERRFGEGQETGSLETDLSTNPAARQDWRDVRALADWFRNRKRTIEAAYAVACDIVEAEGPAIRRVARELLKSGRLDAAEIADMTRGQRPGMTCHRSPRRK